MVALALAALPEPQRQGLADRVLLGATDGWRRKQSLAMGSRPWDACWTKSVNVSACPWLDWPVALRFHTSRQPALLDYERGFVKGGGAGGLLLLAQLQGHPTEVLLEDCDRAC